MRQEIRKGEEDRDVKRQYLGKLGKIDTELWLSQLGVLIEG